MFCLACGGVGSETILIEGIVVIEDCGWCEGTGLRDRDEREPEENPYRDDYEEYRLEREGLL